jgi:hypothetical protein
MRLAMKCKYYIRRDPADDWSEFEADKGTPIESVAEEWVESSGAIYDTIAETAVHGRIKVEVQGHGSYQVFIDWSPTLSAYLLSPQEQSQ